MSENIDDATQLSDTTRLSDSTHLSDATHLASAPHTGTTPSTESDLYSGRLAIDINRTAGDVNDVSVV